MNRPTTPTLRPPLRAAAIAALALLLAADARAQAPVPGDVAPVRKPSGGASLPTVAEIERALLARRFEEAHEMIARRDAAGAADGELLYNDACALAQLGRLAAAEARLLEAVRRGFRDFDHMEADEDLEPIRASTTYEAIMESRARLEQPKPAPERSRGDARRRARDPLAEWKTAHGDGYRYETDAERGLQYATYLDEAAHARMKDELERLERHLIDAYFGKPPEDPVLIAVVRPEDAKRYLESKEIRGTYQHAERRLVARDVGQSLQHEFVHLMHFGHMERTGQRHPIWIQEGLASLYEDYGFRPDGSVEFRPNVRFNIARRQVVSGTAMRWKELAGLKAEAFMADAERLYPQVRAMFEFMARERRLEAFYKELLATSAESPDGLRAIERAFGEPAGTVEERWKRWMKERGAIDDSVSRGDASLGFAAEDAGDGVRIRSFVPKSAARAAGLRVDDVVLAIDGTPVRNREELTLAAAKLEVGREVLVRFRRDGAESEVRVAPRPLGGP
jgi:hypothetical protein